jgi:hypothetical protein
MCDDKILCLLNDSSTLRTWHDTFYYDLVVNFLCHETTHRGWLFVACDMETDHCNWSFVSCFMKQHIMSGRWLPWPWNRALWVVVDGLIGYNISCSYLMFLFLSVTVVHPNFRFLKESSFVSIIAMVHSHIIQRHNFYFIQNCYTSSWAVHSCT